MNINATLIGQAIAFFLFVVFCMKYVWPPIMHALQERKKKIADGLAAGERGKHEQQLAEERAKEILREAKDQAGDIISRAEKRANEIIDEAKDQAREEGGRLTDRLTRRNRPGDQPCQGRPARTGCRPGHAGRRQGAAARGG